MIEGEKVDKEYPPYTERYKIMDEDEMVPSDGLAGNEIEMVLEKVKLGANRPRKYIELAS